MVHEYGKKPHLDETLMIIAIYRFDVIDETTVRIRSFKGWLLSNQHTVANRMLDIDVLALSIRSLCAVDV